MYNSVSYCLKGKGWCHISVCIPDTEKNDWHIAGAQLIELNNYHLCAEDAVLGEANCYNKPLPDLNGLKDYSLLMPQFD